MKKDLFSCIPTKEKFIRKSDRILQRKQKKYSLYNPLFIKWATHIPTNIKVAHIVIGAYNKCKRYLDNKFIDLFPRRDEFYSRLWELFLCNFLLEKGGELVVKRENGTPDFCIKEKDVVIWIEAISPSEHESVQKLGNRAYQLDIISLPRYLRLSNAFETKSNKWKETYVNKGCKESDIFIIAINGNQIDSWCTDKGILGILYGLGLTQINQKGEVSYQDMGVLEKKQNTIVEVGYFLKPEYSHVSGVYLGSCLEDFNKIKIF